MQEKKDLNIYFFEENTLDDWAKVIKINYVLILKGSICHCFSILGLYSNQTF